MQIASLPRSFVAAWLVAAAALLGVGALLAVGAPHGRLATAPEMPAAMPTSADTDLTITSRARTDQLTGEIEHYIATADDADKLWAAYDHLALERLAAAGTVGLDAWLGAMPPRGAAVGATIGADRVLVVWSDPTYLAGARASLFTRSHAGRWAVVARRTLDLAGQYVSLEWSRNGVFLIGGVFQGADAAWLSLIGLDARGSHLQATPVVTHVWAGDERQTSNGIVVRTIIAPKHFITHLFENWREQEITVEWTGRRFRTTRRELEPVIAALETYCAHRRSCATATLQDIAYAVPERARAVFTGMPNDCEYGKPAVALELAKTDRWRVVDVRCAPEP